MILQTACRLSLCQSCRNNFFEFSSVRDPKVSVNELRDRFDSIALAEPREYADEVHVHIHVADCKEMQRRVQHLLPVPLHHQFGDNAVVAIGREGLQNGGCSHSYSQIVVAATSRIRCNVQQILVPGVIFNDISNVLSLNECALIPYSEISGFDQTNDFRVPFHKSENAHPLSMQHVSILVKVIVHHDGLKVESGEIHDRLHARHFSVLR